MILCRSCKFSIYFNYCNLLKVTSSNSPAIHRLSRHDFQTSSSLQTFWERDRRGGYKSDVQMPSKTQLIRDGLQQLKLEINLWQQEMKEKFESDPVLIFRPGEVDVQWQLNSPEALNRWITTSDKDHGEGHSHCELVMSPAGKGLFHGTLDTRVPKDGRIKKAGYCNVRTIRARKSFQRETYLDWCMYNHLVLRVRGDGRSYMLNLSTAGYFDITWFDVYHYVLYTRGGPYWQETRIPFSKFFLASKGRVQDKQQEIPLNKIVNFGISAGDKISGPFSLEIDYIGLEYDPSHTETFAYEMYRTPKYIVAT
ncbi:hypothetical protein B566_EDAN016370 [Ephemera danica]|nr:hypothetical protein B566_EDAN016370 [Ephemera danica]